MVYIAAGVGVALSIITYWSTQRNFRRTSLIEAFHMLNDSKHRKARGVLYGNITSLSFEILSLGRPSANYLYR